MSVYTGLTFRPAALALQIDGARLTVTNNKRIEKERNHAFYPAFNLAFWPIRRRIKLTRTHRFLTSISTHAARADHSVLGSKQKEHG